MSDEVVVADDVRSEPGRETQNLASTALRNAGAAVFGRGTAVLVGMILTPFVLRRLGKDLYGVIITVGAVYEYMSLLRGGMGSALRRYVTLHHHAGDQEKANRYYAAGFWWAAFSRVFILILGLSLAMPICRFLRLAPEELHRAAWGVALMLSAMLIADAGTTLEIPIYATGRTARLANLRTAALWYRVGITVLAFHLLTPSLPVYGGAILVVELTAAMGLVAMLRRSQVVRPAIPRPELGSPAVRRDLLRYGGIALVAQAAQVLYVSTDNLLIGRLYGSGAVTHYSLGTRWAPLILGFLIPSVNTLTPFFTSMEARGEMRRSREVLGKVVCVTSILAVPCCLVPCVVGDLFLAHWVGPEYRDSVRYMIAMLAPLTLEIALAPVWMTLHAQGRIGWIAIGDIVVAVGNVVVSLVLALYFKLGIMGFALGNTIAFLAKNLLLRPLAARHDTTLPPAREFLVPLGRALLGGSPALLLLFLTRRFYDSGLAAVVIAGAIGGVLCLAGSALATLGPNGIRDVVRTLQRAMAGQASRRARPSR